VITKRKKTTKETRGHLTVTKGGARESPTEGRGPPKISSGALKESRGSQGREKRQRRKKKGFGRPQARGKRNMESGWSKKVCSMKGRRFMAPRGAKKSKLGGRVRRP